MVPGVGRGEGRKSTSSSELVDCKMLYCVIPAVGVVRLSITLKKPSGIDGRVGLWPVTVSDDEVTMPVAVSTLS
jgi:hypothetical protein